MRVDANEQSLVFGFFMLDVCGVCVAGAPWRFGAWSFNFARDELRKDS